MHAILQRLRRAALLSAAAGPSDAQLLDAFLSRRDEAAFEALVRRHGPMVLSVCRRVAGNMDDADDAFQATFLVLVRKAGSLRSRQLLPGWLYGVAYRTALKTRTMANKRRVKEKQAAADRPRPEPATAGPPDELLARLDEELNRLPDRYRLPVVLCELQGKSRKEASQLLGLPEGTLSWRLSHARKLLAQRLARYGAMLSAGAVAAALSEGVVSAVPPSLARAVTIQALAAEMIPAPVQILTEGVLKAMLLSKLKVVWGVALAALVGVGAVGLMYRPASAADPTRPGGNRTASATEDELDELRLEIAALRKGLQATRERVRTLEDQVAKLQFHRHGRTGIMGGGMGIMSGGMGSMGGGMRGMMGGGMGMGGGMMGGGMGMTEGGAGHAAGKTVGAVPKGGARGMMQMMQMMRGKGAGPGMGGAGVSKAGAGGTGGMHGKGDGPGMGGGSMSGATGKPGMGTGGPTGSGGAASNNKGAENQAWSAYRRLAQEQVQRWNSLKQKSDPLVRAQAALKRLRQHPDDKRAADALELALMELQAQRRK